MGLAIFILAILVLVAPFLFGLYKGYSLLKQEATDQVIMNRPKPAPDLIAPKPDFLPVGKHLLNVSSAFPPATGAKQNLSIEARTKTLLNESVCLALRLLTKHSENMPFSLLMHANGEFHALACDDSENPEEHSAEDLFHSVAMASKGCISEGGIQAISLVHHGYLGNSPGGLETPVIVVHLEHVGGNPNRLVVPYVRKADDLVFAYSATMEDAKHNFLNNALS